MHDKESLRNMVYTAFNINDYNYENIDVVYPKGKEKMTKDKLDEIFEKWIKKPVPKPDDDNNDNDDNPDSVMNEEREVDEGAIDEPIGEENIYNKIFKKRNNANFVDGNVLDLLNNHLIERDTKLYCLTESFCPRKDKLFPQLKGDIVTFIGTTFIKYGETEPYLNHCIVRKECSDLPQVKNSKIECYSTEKKVLLAWAKLIQKEDPDIIIGYNIFGFDYIFLYDRACELGTDCVNQFLKLSRNKNESCLSRKWINGREEKGIEANSLYIASGQHDIKYIKMNGRLQIDLYNYFRREYQLIKYKLEERVFLEYNDKTEIAFLKGVEENYTKISKIESSLNTGTWSDIKRRRIVLTNIKMEISLKYLILIQKSVHL